MAPERAALFDIDGVLTVSWEPLAGAARAVQVVRGAGWRVALLTNTTSAPRRLIGDRLRRAGIEVDDGEIVTAVRAAAGYLAAQHGASTCYLLNHGHAEEDLGDVTLVDEDAGVVLTGGAGPDVTYRRLDTAYRMLVDGAALVSMHRNLSWQTAQGSSLDMGAFIEGLERAAGVRATVVGKPAPAFFHTVLGDLGVAPQHAVMVGDDIEADVFGAQSAGVRGVLVRTGKFRPEVLQAHPGRAPDDVIDSVADFPALLGITEPGARRRTPR